MTVHALLPISLLSIALLGPHSRMLGQDRAAACFFSSDFETGIPSGWDIGPAVERQDPDGNGLEEFVPAWTTGTAQDANAGGFFPVPDVPVGNRSAMANDDAPPCNCNMAEVMLTTPVIDLSTRSGVGLECRVFHEQSFGGGEAFVEANIGSGWILMATVPVQSAVWQTLSVDLSAFDGQANFQLRFRWSDNGNWASGFAVDDICLRERLPFDMSVIDVTLGDHAADPFIDPARTLAYSMMPLEHAGPFFATVTIMNRGMQVVDVTGVEARVLFNGEEQQLVSQQPIGPMIPGEQRRVVLPITWTSTGVGLMSVEGRIGALTPDNDPSDNQLSKNLRITGPGWENGYGAMARDADVVQGGIGGSQNFITSNRMELLNSGTVRGISAVLSGNSQVGAQVRGMLFDSNMAFVDSTARHTLTEADVLQAGAALPLYLAFASPVDLAAGDYFVGIQHLDDGNELYVSLSGNGPIGGSVIMEGGSFVLSYLRSVPMVRLHVSDYGVGVAEQAAIEHEQLLIYPVPMSENGWLSFQLYEPTEVFYTMVDLQGRVQRTQGLGTLAAGSQQVAVDVTGLSAGSYVLSLHAGERLLTRRFVVAGR